MDLIFLLFTGFTIGISGAMIPGPLTFFAASATLKTGRLAGFKVISGHIILEFILIGVIFLGFHRFLRAEWLLSAISIIGSLALIIMGVLLLLNSGKMKISGIKTDSGFGRGLVLGGIFFSIISPGFLVWWATIGASTAVKALTLFGLLGVAILTLGHWSADVVWYGALSYAIDKGRACLSDRVYQNVMRFFSTLLIILGIYFLLKP